MGKKGIRSSRDGFLITPAGKKTNIPYEAVLNDFGRNIKKINSFMLSEQEKKRTMRVLGEAGFAQYLIPNQQMKAAYGTNMPDVRNYLIEQSSPMKKKIKKKERSHIG